MSQQLQNRDGTNNTNNLQQPKGQDVERVQSRRVVAPAVDIFETKSDVWLVADVPGVAREGLTLEAKDGEIGIRGTPGATFGDDFDYARAFRLPPGVDVDAISAELKDGVLTLRLPKPPAMKPRTIAVQ